MMKKVIALIVVILFCWCPANAQDKAKVKEDCYDTIENKIPEPARFEHYVGEKFGGGIIFNLWKDAKGEEHGLIASLADVSEGVVWNTYEKVTGAASLDDGFENTKKIVSELDNCDMCAGGLCYAYSYEGFKDWYLPASWELFELYKNMNVVNQILMNDEDDSTVPISREYYWSSTEGSTGSAWRQNFADGNQKYYYHKYSKSRLRAIRRF